MFFLFQPFPLRPLWRSALHEWDGGLRWPHLHDPSHQGYLSHFAGGLPEDHRRQKGRNQLLHLADDQGLHEESGPFEPPPNCPGATLKSIFDVPRYESFLHQLLVPFDGKSSCFCCAACRWMMSWRSRRTMQAMSWELPWCTSKWDQSLWSTLWV